MTWMELLRRAWAAWKLWRAPTAAECPDCGLPLLAGEVLRCADCIELLRAIDGEAIDFTPSAMMTVSADHCQFCFEPALAGIVYGGRPLCAVHEAVRKEYVAALGAGKNVPPYNGAYGVHVDGVAVFVRQQARHEHAGREVWENVDELYPH